MSETASTSTENTTEGSEPAEAVTPVVDSVDKLPEFAQKMISDLRAEAAKHRTAKSEAAEAAKTEVTTAFEAKLAESNTTHEATKAKLNQANEALAKITTAVQAGVPTDKVLGFAELLKGDNPDELKAHAETLKGMFGGLSGSSQQATDSSQGLGNGNATAGDDFGSWIVSQLGK